MPNQVFYECSTNGSVCIRFSSVFNEACLVVLALQDQMSTVGYSGTDVEFDIKLLLPSQGPQKLCAEGTMGYWDDQFCPLTTIPFKAVRDHPLTFFSIPDP